MAGTATSAGLRAVVEAAAALGLPRGPLEEALALDPSRHPLEERVPAPVVRRFWALLEKLGGDELIGVRIAEKLVQLRPGPLPYLLSSSSCLADAWPRVAANLRFVFDSDDEPVTRQIDGRRVIGYRRPPLSDPLIPQSEACVVSTFVLSCRALIGPVFGPAAASFQHPPPPWAAALRRWLGCPVRFAAEHTTVEVTEAAWRAPFPTHDPALLDLVTFATDRLAAAAPRPARATLAGRLELWLGDRLERSQGVAVEEAARALGVSARSLQRKLAAGGGSFRASLDAVRRQLALRLLERPDASVGEVAAQLGYAQQSQFTRAFRRWTGESPARWRRRAR